VSELYIEVKDTEDVEVDRRRAEAIVSAEARMSSTEQENDAYFPEFPEFLEALRVEVEDESVQLVKVSQVQDDVAKLSAKVDRQSEKMEDLAGKVASDMAELKALMAQLVQQGKATPTGSVGFSSVAGQVLAQNRAKQRSMLAQ
jgi:capsule polysaccharide export protein KpsE/RkpR